MSQLPDSKTVQDYSERITRSPVARVSHATREALFCRSLAEDRASIGRQFAVTGDVVEFK